MFNIDEFVDVLSNELDGIEESSRDFKHAKDDENQGTYYISSVEHEDLYLKLYPLYIKGKNYFKTLSKEKYEIIMEKIMDNIHEKVGFWNVRSINLSHEYRIKNNECILKVIFKYV